MWAGEDPTQKEIEVSASQPLAVTVLARSSLRSAFGASRWAILPGFAPVQGILDLLAKIRLPRSVPRDLPPLTTHRTNHPQGNPGPACTRDPRHLGMFPAPGVGRKASLHGIEGALDVAFNPFTPRWPPLRVCLHQPAPLALHHHQPLPVRVTILPPLPLGVPLRWASEGTGLFFLTLHGRWAIPTHSLPRSSCTTLPPPWAIPRRFSPSRADHRS